MDQKRRLAFILIGLALCVIVLFLGVTTPPDRLYPERLRNAIREGNDDTSAIQANWDLAEYYYAQGDLVRARAEYERIISDYPYTEIDYGYRTDDARDRIREIDARLSGRDYNSSLPDL